MAAVGDVVGEVGEDAEAKSEFRRFELKKEAPNEERVEVAAI